MILGINHLHVHSGVGCNGGVVKDGDADEVIDELAKLLGLWCGEGEGGGK